MSVEEWLDEGRAQSFASQHARSDATKLIVTFAAGIAVTMTATALQVGQPSWGDQAAVVITAVSLALAIVVILWDRLKDPDHEQTLARAVALGRTEQQKLDDLRFAAFTFAMFNEEQLARQRAYVPWQVGASILATATAAVSLLFGA